MRQRGARTNQQLTTTHSPMTLTSPPSRSTPKPPASPTTTYLSSPPVGDVDASGTEQSDQSVKETVAHTDSSLPDAQPDASNPVDSRPGDPADSDQASEEPESEPGEPVSETPAPIHYGSTGRTRFRQDCGANGVTVMSSTNGASRTTENVVAEMRSVLAMKSGLIHTYLGRRSSPASSHS